MYICLCKGLTEEDIRRTTPAAKRCEESLAEELGLHDEDCCGYCVRNIGSLVHIANATRVEEAVAVS